jgi:nucleotide-binding universal stress UspA family protein
MFERILVPTDGSWGSQEAVSKAVELAADYDATVHALSVVDESVYSAYSGDEYVHEHEGLEEGLEEVAADAVEAVVEEAAERDVAVQTSVVHGTPHEVILDSAEEAGADLIVMGTKRRSDEYRQFVGSVTKRVADATTVPVLIVKTEEE